MVNQHVLFSYKEFSEFWVEHKEALYLNEEMNSLLLGLCEEAQHGETKPTCFSVVSGKGSPLIWALITPRGMVLSAEKSFLETHAQLSDGEAALSFKEHIKALVDSVRKNSPTILSVVGPSPLAEVFAKIHSNEQHSLHMQQSLRTLNSVKFPNPKSAGYVKICESADLEKASQWIHAYRAESWGTAVSEGDCEDYARGLIKHKRAFFWTVGDEPHSICTLARPTRKTLSLSHVYTPAEHRRQGYSRSLVADVAHMALTDEKKQHIMLYTDSENTAAERIYKNMGFEKIMTSSHFILGSQTTAKTVTELERKA